jgi:hypothetical protein
MKRTGFRKLSYEEIIEKKKAQDQKRLSKRFVPIGKSRKPKTKPKPDRIKSLKTKLWKTFSIYIRKSYANQYGMVKTSDGELKHWKEVDCGHLFANTERNKQLGGNELWYYENNFAPQSSSGNRFNSKDSAKVYMLWAIKKYGIKEVEKMKKLKETPRKFTEEELEEKYRHYKHLSDKILV